VNQRNCDQNKQETIKEKYARINKRVKQELFLMWLIMVFLFILVI